MNRKSIVETIVAVIVFLFLYTGLSKYVNHSTFQSVLSKSPLIGKLSYPISLTLPGLEILLATLLIIPRTRLKALYLSGGVLVVFTIYLIYMVIYTPKLPCSCGGVLSQLTWTQHIFFNFAFIGLSIWATLIQKKISKENGGNSIHINKEHLYV